MTHIVYLINISKGTINVELVSGETLFVLPRERIEDVTITNYCNIKDYIKAEVS